MSSSAMIHYIHNEIAATSFAHTEGHFIKQFLSLPTPNPDEAIIRAVNFNGTLNDTNLYLLWCSLNNGIIASFCGANISSNFPQTRIWLNHLISNSVEFKVYTPTISGGMEFVTDFVGDLAIHIDFIKYKDVPMHA